MSDREEKPHAGEDGSPLELNKETLQDLDIEATEGENVKGGALNYHTQGSISQLCSPNVALSGAKG